MENEKIDESAQQSSGGKNNMVKVIVIIAIAAVVLAVAGYFVSRYVARKVGESAAEKILEDVTGGNVDVDSSNGSTKITTDEGTAELNSSKEWPNDMPTSVPKFTFGTVSSSSKVTLDNKPMWSVEFVKVEANAASLYGEFLLSSGWSTADVLSASGSESIVTESDQYSLTLAVDTGAATATLVVSEK